MLDHRCKQHDLKKLRILLITSLNPQNLRNITKKVAKISIIQILMSNLSVKTTVFCYFFAAF